MTLEKSPAKGEHGGRSDDPWIHAQKYFVDVEYETDVSCSDITAEKLNLPSSQIPCSGCHSC